jgi:hypothetical protein
MKLPKKVQPALRTVSTAKIARQCQPSYATRAECALRCGHIRSDGAYNQCIDYCLTGL